MLLLCVRFSRGRGTVSKIQAGEALPTQSCEGQAKPCHMRVGRRSQGQAKPCQSAKGRRSLASLRRRIACSSVCFRDSCWNPRKASLGGVWTPQSWRADAEIHEQGEDGSRVCQRLWWLRSETEPGAGGALPHKRSLVLVRCQEARAHTRLHHVASGVPAAHIGI